MAEYNVIPTVFTDFKVLTAALGDLGFTQLELNEQPVPLRDQAGLAQNQRANLIIKSGAAGASADIGFRWNTNSSILLFLVARPDHSRFVGSWLRQLSQRYRWHIGNNLLQANKQAQKPVKMLPPAEPVSGLGGLLGGLVERFLPNLAELHNIERAARTPNFPATAGFLAEVVAEASSTSWQDIAWQALQQVTEQHSINRICEVWGDLRHPQLEKLLVEKNWVATAPVELKILTAFKLGRVEVLGELKANAIQLVMWACHDTDPVIASRAQAYVQDMQNPALLNGLAEMWFYRRNPTLLEPLQAKNYLPSRPANIRAVLGLKLGLEDKLSADSPAILPTLVEACNDQDPAIAEAAVRVLARLKQTRTRQALLELVMERDVPAVEKIVLERGDLPTEPAKRALFFFVTEQWERYDALDFDHSLLQRAYGTVKPAVKRRIAEKVRKAGRPDYLEIITGASGRQAGANISPEETELTVEVLTANQDWASLWLLVFEVNLKWSNLIVTRLVQANWQPQQEEERKLFEDLKGLVASQPFEQSQTLSLKEVLPPALFRARARVTGRINGIAFSPVRPLVAFSTGNGKVVVWNMQTARREALLTGFAHSVGRLAFTPEGVLVCAERTNSETDICKLYYWSGGQALIEIGQHTGSITVLQALGQNQILSAGRDAMVKIWEIGQTKAKQITKLDDWPRTACISNDGQQMAFWHNGLMTLIGLPDLNLLGTIQARGTGVARSFVFAPDEKTIIAARHGYGIGIFVKKEQNWRSSLTIYSSLEPLTGQVQSLTFLPGKNVMLAATTEGAIHLVEWSNAPQIKGRIEVPHHPLTSLTVSPNGAFMAVGDSDASFSLWDLRVLELDTLSEINLAQGTANQLMALNLILANDVKLTDGQKALLQYAAVILQHRLRYNIELGEEVPLIEAGDFDIEIEG